MIVSWAGVPLPPQLAGLRTAGPYALLGAAAAVAAWFNRERAFLLALSLLTAFAAYDYFPTPLVYTAAAILVPANALLALLRPERGARFGQGWKWLALLLCEGALIFLLRDSFSSANFLLHTPPAPPLLARLSFSAAFAAAVWRAWPAHTPLEVGVGAALAAFFIAVGWIDNAGVYAIYMASAGAILLVGVLQESHRMAFRDALTGLPNRRALEDQLRALAPPYAIAMVDVDHFKKFNDTHGHDIGDQVLKLVAARLAEAGGVARAFRYGGEEFTVVFRGAKLSEAMPELEKMRAAVEGYKMTIRGKDRPKSKKEGVKRRTGGRLAEPADFERTDQILSVTVSIGGAEPGKRLRTPQEVVKGADEALYRAKERGRNQVSR